MVGSVLVVGLIIVGLIVVAALVWFLTVGSRAGTRVTSPPPEKRPPQP